ncbi:hypothetical protein SAMN05878391_2613 [Salinicoccus kekensis]|uniref:Uncharacterized protein n=1 Tax=Salinicoccus kekensis TaxID=714307 RepID=A0A285UTG2_9STAP|nr:hypothetical protein SAMN05878391_2613 [Salinicoccus kekensis]
MEPLIIVEQKNIFLINTKLTDLYFLSISDIYYMRNS